MSLDDIFKDNDGGVDYEKALIYTKILDVYMNDSKALIKGGYSVEVSGSDGNKVLWGVVDAHVVEEGKEHDEIGLRGFDFNFLLRLGGGDDRRIEWVSLFINAT